MRERQRETSEREIERDTERERVCGRGRERWRDRGWRSVREHPLRRDSKPKQRSHGGRHRRSLIDISSRWRSREQRENKEDTKCSNKNVRDDSYDKKENWTKVASRRTAKERKKKTSEERISHNHGTRGKPTDHHLNWRNQEDITSY